MATLTLVDLEEFANSQEAELARFAAEKRAENRRMEEELERHAARYRAQIAANLEAVARFQQALADWNRWKQRETGS